MADLRTEIRERDGIPVLAVDGDLDGDAGEALDAAFEEAAADDPDALILNFDDLGFMNSSGIALVVSLLGRARQRQIEVRACGLSDHYRHIFEITRLADFMTVCVDEDEAVGERAASRTDTCAPATRRSGP